ncbi:hypothetical protein B0H13DRAFT_1885161 [Mycena leptocephala]|nr:hypothetical protein B0H13DRAFT_1885161 [Mycena leptocephala]
MGRGSRRRGDSNGTGFERFGAGVVELWAVKVWDAKRAKGHAKNPELRVYAGAHFPVCYMEEKDAVCLLLGSAGEESSPANELIAAEIVRVLSYLPLAIVQAGSFVSTSGDLDSYLDLYMNNPAQLLREKPVQTRDSYVWTVYTTWQISFDRLSKPAAMFLQLCSFLYRDGISEDIFSRAVGYNFPSWGPTKDELQMPLKFLSHFKGPTDEWDTLKFVKITNQVKAYSLISFDPKRKVFSIHPLVHSWSRTTLSNEESYHSCVCAVLGMSLGRIPNEEEQLASLRLISHAESLMHVPSHIFAVFGLQYEMLAGTYRILGEFQKAEELGILVEKQKLDLGDEHPDTISAMHNLALTYGHNQCQKAEELQVIVLEKQKRLLGNDHPNTLQAMTNLASTYHRLGRFREAEALQIVVLEKRRKLLGEDRLVTLHTMGNFASTCRRLGHFQICFLAPQQLPNFNAPTPPERPDKGQPLWWGIEFRK